MHRKDLFNSVLIGLFSALLLFSAGSIFAQSKNDKKKAKTFVEQGDKAFRQRNYREAVNLYGQAVTLVPNDSYGHFWKANSHYSLKEYGEADREFALAMNQGFKPIEIYKIRWYLYYDQKDFEAALVDVQKGLQIEPKNMTLLLGLGDIYYRKGSFPEALQAFQKALLLTPKDGDIFYYIARVHTAMGNVKEQGTSADEAIKKNTKYVGESYYLLADSLDRQKNYGASIDAYQKSIAAKPDTYQAYRNLANVYKRQNRLTEAIDVSKRALNLFPLDGGIYTDLSWYYSLADRPSDAVGAAQAATKILPNEYMGFTNLCRAFNESKQYQQAIAACNTALKLNPKDGETNFYLGRASDFLKRTDEATRYYRVAVVGLLEFTRTNPDYSDGFYLLGNAYFADNHRDRAVQAFERCLQLSPSFAKARSNLGTILVLQKNKMKAMEQYNYLLAQDPVLAANLKVEIDKL